MATASQFALEGSWEEIVRRADQFAGKRVRVTVLPENGPAPSLSNGQNNAPGDIREGDMVSVRRDLETEGYSLHAGMIGAIVSVYREGEAFAVEFPNLERGSAVVTLRRNQVEKAGPSA